MFKFFSNITKKKSNEGNLTKEVLNNKMPAEDQNYIDIKDDIYNIIKIIKDPEFDNTLEELKVVNENDITFKRKLLYISILWTPTVEHCKFASHIGLSIRKKLENELANYDKYKIEIIIKDNKHKDFSNLNKQINDKERFAAALENKDLMIFIDNLIGMSS